MLGFRDGDEGDDDWQIDQAAAEWLAEAAERVLDGEPVEAVHAALPVIHDAAGRKVTAKMLRAALQRPASAGLITDNGEVTGTAAIGGPLDEPTFNGWPCCSGRAGAAARSRRPLPARPAAAVRQVRQPAHRRAVHARLHTGPSRRAYYACRTRTRPSG